MLISYLSARRARAHATRRRLCWKRGKVKSGIFFWSVRSGESRRSRGGSGESGSETLKGWRGEDLSAPSDEASDAVSQEEGERKKNTGGRGGVLRFHLSLSVYDMSRKGEHIKCMTHESVCASVPHQRPAERVASTAAGGMEGKKKKKAISCFTWCGYPISYTKHVTKQMMPICFCSWWMFYPPQRAFTNM